MDSLRITLLVLGAVVVALIYAWDRMSRGKNSNRYARWGVSDDGAETHIVGRNSGDPETDSKLVSTAYDPYIEEESSYEDELVETSSDIETLETEISEIEASLQEVEEEDDWQSEVTASLGDDTYTEDAEPDLDSDPEINVNPIEDITSELEALEEIIAHEPEQNNMELGDLDIPIEASAIEPEKIIAIHVLAREGSIFSGPDILNHLIGLDLQYGEMNVFHRLDVNGKSIFSMANAMEPGVFDLATMGEMSTPALLFILSLPNSLPALEAYDSMLAAARSLTDSLNGRLCDETRSVLTRQAIDVQRAELNAF